jgi:hypothetical protein
MDGHRIVRHSANRYHHGRGGDHDVSVASVLRQMPGTVGSTYSVMAAQAATHGKFLRPVSLCGSQLPATQKNLLMRSDLLRLVVSGRLRGHDVSVAS